MILKWTKLTRIIEKKVQIDVFDWEFDEIHAYFITKTYISFETTARHRRLLQLYEQHRNAQCDDLLT